MSRRMLAALAASFLVGTLGCGPEATTPPAPPRPVTDASGPRVTDPPPVVEGPITQLDVGGVMVLVKRTPGAELAAIQLHVRGGVRNWGKADAGVEQLAVTTAATGGTKTLDKDAFAHKLASLGSEVGATSGNDYAVLRAKTLTASFDTTFGLLADTFLAPALPASELELHRQAMLAALRNEQDDPDARLELRSRQQVFKGHPYENRPEGTAESIGALTPTQVASHLGKLREKSRLLLVVVGDVDATHVATLVRGAFGALPRGAYREEPLPALAFDKPSLESETVALPTTYIKGTYPSSSIRDADFFAAMVANEHLQYRMFEEVRTKRNLSYAPSAGVSWTTSMPLGHLYVTAVDPETTMRVMFDEVAKLKAKPITDKELAGAKSTFATHHLLSSETSDGQAAWLGRAQIHAGDFRFEARLVEKVKAVTAAEIQAYANARMKNLQFEVIGPKKADAKLYGGP